MKKYGSLREPLILLEEPLRSFYWSGVMDADGSYNRRNVTLTSASLRFVQDFAKYLSSLNIQSKITERNDGTNQLYVPRRFHDVYKEHFMCLHPEKRYEFMKLRKGGTKELSKAQSFLGFDESKLVNGYFNFNYLKKIQIVGLGDFLRRRRGKKTMKQYAGVLGTTQGNISHIETNKRALSIEILSKILAKETEALMPFLLVNRNNIRFRKLRSPPIRLDLKPNKTLHFLAKKMLIYKTAISLPIDDINLQNKIRDYFELKISNNRINNSLLQYYLLTFGVYKTINEY
jgi:transcriptional regulator with XRE-family HTH domain